MSKSSTQSILLMIAAGIFVAKIHAFFLSARLVGWIGEGEARAVSIVQKATPQTAAEAGARYPFVLIATDPIGVDEWETTPGDFVPASRLTVSQDLFNKYEVGAIASVIGGSVRRSPRLAEVVESDARSAGLSAVVLGLVFFGACLGHSYLDRRSRSREDPSQSRQ